MKKLLLATVFFLSSQMAQAADIALCPAVRAESAALPEYYAAREMRNGLDGWLFSRRDFNKAQRINMAGLHQFKRFIQILNDRNITLAATLIPNRLWASRMHYDASLYLPNSYDVLKSSYLERIGQLRELGVIAPDLLTPLELNPPAFDYFFKRDHHWTPAGANLTAKMLAAELANQTVMTGIPQVTFSLTQEGMRDHKGSYTAYAEKACSIEIEPEQLEKFSLQQESAPSLLDENVPEIVLVGTSFSNEMFGFPAALQLNLNREVENTAVDGGGTDTAMTSFLSSPRYEQHPPKLIIWEIPYLYSYNLPLMWRQIIPAAQGACTDVGALAMETTAITEETILLDNLDRVIKAGSDFLVINSDDASLIKFDLRLDYSDEKSETVTISRSTRAENSGRFFLELSAEQNGRLQRVTLIPAAPASGHITTRLCEGT